MPETAVVSGAVPATAGASSAPATAAPNPAPVAAPVLGGEGGSAAWHATLPPEVAAKPWVKTHKTAESFYKSVEEAQGLIGRSIQVPKSGEGLEAWERVWNKLGRPATADGYKITAPKLPEGVAMPKVLSEGFTSFAHGIGLSAWQAQKLVDHVGSRLAAEISPPAPDAKVTVAALKQAWGGAYEKNLTLAQRAIRYAGGEKLQAALKRTGAANDPDVAIAFARWGAMLAEDNVISGEGPVGTATAKTELAEILDNPQHAYWDKAKPGHKEALTTVQRLNEKIHGKP